MLKWKEDEIDKGSDKGRILGDGIVSKYVWLGLCWVELFRGMCIRYRK